MFGRNKRIKKFDSNTGYYWVREIFSTIQGEGPFAGRPATFVRLGGCNLACTFCDTDFDVDKSMLMHSQEIVAKCNELQNTLIVLTGGEPLLQDVSLLLRDLCALLYEVQIETAGTVWPEGLTSALLDNKELVSIVCSPKTGRVKDQVRMFADAFKYVVKAGQCDQVTGLPVQSTQRSGVHAPLFVPGPTFPHSKIYLQPMDEQDPVANAANVEYAVKLCRSFGYRLSLQLHKILELP